MIAERCQESVHTLKGLVTWFSLNLPNPETNPHLKLVVQEVDKKKKEIATLVRHNYINTLHTKYMYVDTLIYRIDRKLRYMESFRNALLNRMVLLSRP